MEGFKSRVDEIIESEITAELKKCGYVLENGFKEMIHSKYKFSSPTISGALERVHTKMGLTRRRMSDELKAYYNLDMPGFPAAYIANPSIKV